MRIAAGADHAGWALKQALVARLRAGGHEVLDLGTDGDGVAVDYPNYAHAVAKVVERCEVERGLLVCGTGLGMSMAANRHPHVRAADCWTPEVAELSRRHNDANVLCLGGRLLDEEGAWKIVEAWLRAPFEGGRHERRVAAIEGAGAGGAGAGGAGAARASAPAPASPAPESAGE